MSDDLSYEEQPVQILGSREKELCNKTISLVKVLWRNHLVEETTWEREDQMRSQYPHPGHKYEFRGRNFSLRGVGCNDPYQIIRVFNTFDQV